MRRDVPVVVVIVVVIVVGFAAFTGRPNIQTVEYLCPEQQGNDQGIQHHGDGKLNGAGSELQKKALQDLEKAQWYIEREISRRRNEISQHSADE